MNRAKAPAVRRPSAAAKTSGARSPRGGARRCRGRYGLRAAAGTHASPFASWGRGHAAWPRCPESPSQTRCPAGRRRRPSASAGGPVARVLPPGPRWAPEVAGGGARPGPPPRPLGEGAHVPPSPPGHPPPGDFIALGSKGQASDSKAASALLKPAPPGLPSERKRDAAAAALAGASSLPGLAKRPKLPATPPLSALGRLAEAAVAEKRAISPSIKEPSVVPIEGQPEPRLPLRMSPTPSLPRDPGATSRPSTGGGGCTSCASGLCRGAVIRTGTARVLLLTQSLQFCSPACPLPASHPHGSYLVAP